jgi:hypothetical protein
VLRSVTVGLALAILAAACALVEEPVPPNTIPVQVQVRNERAGPVKLTVMTPNGVLPGAVLPGAVRPASVPAHSTTDVTFYVPSGEWWIASNDSPDIIGSDLSEAIGTGCALGIELNPHEEYAYGCLPLDQNGIGPGAADQHDGRAHRLTNRRRSFSRSSIPSIFAMI